MKKLVKGLVAVVVVVVLVVVIALAAHPLWVGPVVKAVAEKVGPKYTGTPIVLTKCGVNLYSGHVELAGFELANPEGCSEKTAASVGTLKVDLDTLSALKDVIVVRSIEVSGIFVSYVKGASGKFNFTEIGDNAKAASGSAEPSGEAVAQQPAAQQPAPEQPAAQQTAEKQTAEKKPGKKVIIERLAIGDIKLATLGMRIPLVPGTLVIKDIGKESQGVSFEGAWAAIWAKIKSSAGLAGDGFSALGSLGAEAGKKGLDLGKKGLDAGAEGLKNALDSAKQLNVDGAKDALKNTGKKLESVGESFKGLFK